MIYKFKTKPWDHQLKALEKSYDKEYYALLMEYGTGKTWVIINNAGALYAEGKIEALVVIAPNGVHYQWVNEQVPAHLSDNIPRICRTWTGSSSKKFKSSLEDFWKADGKLKIFTINIEALRTAGRARQFLINFLTSFKSMLVVDESTRIKNYSAKQTKFILNRLAHLAKYRRTLTGNEITRSPFDVYCPYRFLHDKFWDPIPNYYVFTHRYGIWMKKTQYKTKREYPMLVEYRNLEELRRKTTPASFLVRKEDCMDLPKKIYQPIFAEMNKTQALLYNELKNDFIMEYKGHEIEVTTKIALAVRFQQIVGGFYPETNKSIGEYNPKLQALLYDLEDIDTDCPIIIWSRFIAEIDHIAFVLGQKKKVRRYYGATSREERMKIIDEFNQGEIDFLVANPATAGTGLNLQKSYIHYYFSNSYNAEDRWQSEDRSHRGGQIHNCLYKDIFIRGTIDDTIQKSIKDKVHMAEFFNNKPLEDII